MGNIYNKNRNINVTRTRRTVWCWFLSEKCEKTFILHADDFKSNLSTVSFSDGEDDYVDRQRTRAFTSSILFKGQLADNLNRWVREHLRVNSIKTGREKQHGDKSSSEGARQKHMIQ